MKQFDENIKPGFRSRDDEDQYITFPMTNIKDDPAKGIKSNAITLTGLVAPLLMLEPPTDILCRQSLHEIFSPVFREIDKLVQEQVNMVMIKRMKENHATKSIKVNSEPLKSNSGAFLMSS